MEESQARFKLEGSGLRFVRSADTLNTEVEIYELDTTTTIINLEMIRSKKAARFGTFLVAKVSDAVGKTLWSFPKYFNGYGRLVLFESQHFIYLEDKDGKIHGVVPVEDLSKVTPVVMGEQTVFLGGRSRLELLWLKMRIARSKGRDYTVLPEEEGLRDKLRQVEAALRREQEEAAAAAAEANKARRAAILNRRNITVYTADGYRLFGTPVVGEEWEVLPNDQYGIEVESYDAVTGVAGKPIVAFIVSKSRKSGRCERVQVRKGLSFDPPAKSVRTESGVPVPKALGVLLLEVEGNLIEVFHFDKENFRLLRQQNTNSGAIVAVGEPTADGKYILVRLDGDKYLTVGQGKPLST